MNPLIIWLWIGGGIFTAGGLLAFAPFKSRRAVEVDETAPAGGQPV
jgi:cytochrome c biogenesis factor